MNPKYFSENLKRFRNDQKLTQENVADRLCVSPQAVSRWECGTTMPDVMLLPEIAELYKVTVDALFRKNGIAYDNYAERLSAVYEMTDDPEDFIRADFEYRKLMKLGELSQKDKFCYGFLHHQMLRYCKKKALELYNSVLEGDAEVDRHSYRRVMSLKAWLAKELGQGEEMITEHKEKMKENATEMDWEHLIELLIMFDKNEDAYECFLEASEKYPNNWFFPVFGGGALQGLKRYDEAEELYKKAGELGTPFHDEMLSLADLYEEIGEIEKAIEMQLKVAERYQKEGYEFEAQKCLKYIECDLKPMLK